MVCRGRRPRYNRAADMGLPKGQVPMALVGGCQDVGTAMVRAGHAAPYRKGEHGGD